MSKYKIDRKKSIDFRQMMGNVLVITGLVTMFIGGKNVIRIADRNKDAASQTIEAINPDYVETTETPEQIIQKQKEHLEQTTQEQEYVSKYDFEELRKTNSDIVAIIEGDCFINGYYPIVSSKSFDDLNDKLHEDLNGDYSVAGLIVADPSNDKDFRGIVRFWGHHLGNEEGLMFTSILNFANKEYYNEHRYLILYTEKGEYILEVFACTKDNPMEQPIGVQTEEEMIQNIEDVRNRSLIQTNVEIGSDDTIVILTTCTEAGSANEPDIRFSLYCKGTPVLRKTNTNAKSI